MTRVLRYQRMLRTTTHNLPCMYAINALDYSSWFVASLFTESAKPLLCLSIEFDFAGFSHSDRLRLGHASNNRPM